MFMYQNRWLTRLSARLQNLGDPLGGPGLFNSLINSVHGRSLEEVITNISGVIAAHYRQMVLRSVLVHPPELLG